jgi:hypothetical protein
MNAKCEARLTIPVGQDILVSYRFLQLSNDSASPDSLHEWSELTEWGHVVLQQIGNPLQESMCIDKKINILGDIISIQAWHDGFISC